MTTPTHPRRTLLDELREASAKATKGPYWVEERNDRIGLSVVAPGKPPLPSDAVAEYVARAVADRSNARLFAQLGTHRDALLDVVEAAVPNAHCTDTIWLMTRWERCGECRGCRLRNALHAFDPGLLGDDDAQ